VSGLEGLGALSRIGAEEVRIRIGQRDDPEGRLAPNASDLDDRFAEVELGMTGGWLSGTKASLEYCLVRMTAVCTWE
jgi:hypothetical protein